MYFHVPGTKPGIAILYDLIADAVKDWRPKRLDGRPKRLDGKLDHLTIDFFEKIDIEALRSVIHVVGKDNNVDLAITGFKVKKSEKKLEIFVDISGESNKTKLKQEINRGYDTETQKRKDNGTINFLYIKNYWVQNSQTNLPGASGQIDSGDTRMSTNFENNFSGANVGNFTNKIADNGIQQANQHIYQAERKTLSEAAKEIQKLLEQLDKFHPDATEIEKIAYVNDETTPSFKRRIVGALGAGGEAAIEEFLDNSYLNIGKAIIKGWIKPD
ncbi:hypothetical protein [Tolypothrix sp. VBCCA 56010]|uniref:hypothetical protein n=1 Tax=Tolypothrix sp. VBCCA 56010 TaxID=3137731 RepID=UPI003D7C98CF